MTEIRFDKAAQELNIPPEKGKELATQLKDFIKLQSERWKTGYVDFSHMMDDRKGYYSPKIDFKSFNELPNKGVGETFLIVWNNGGQNTNGDHRMPLIVCLATGESLEVSHRTEMLSIKYFEVGTLPPGGKEIRLNENLSLEERLINPHSTVILSPDSFK